MYISKVVLENFQAFEKGEFNLSPNLNILVGVSNVGKSSVARALSLVLFNQWDKSWCKHGAKFCRVTLVTNGGLEVVREKGEKINRYILRIPGVPEQLFESFGTTVPEQIQQALKIHTVQVDTTDTLNLNLAGQMDSLFLLSQTGSYRAKVLGKLSGATFLDHAIRELNKDKRQVTAEKNIKDAEIVELQGQVDKLGGIESFADELTELSVRLTLLADAEQRVERIRNLLERVKALKDTWTRESQKSELLAQIVPDSTASLSARVDKIKAVSLLWNKIVSFKRAFERENKLNELLTPVDLSAIPVLADKTTNFKAKSTLAERLLNKLSQVSLISRDLDRAEQDHKEAAAQYTELLREAGVCPTCNQATNHLCVQ